MSAKHNHEQMEDDEGEDFELEDIRFTNEDLSDADMPRIVARERPRDRSALRSIEERRERMLLRQELTDYDIDDVSLPDLY